MQTFDMSERLRGILAVVLVRSSDPENLGEAGGLAIDELTEGSVAVWFDSGRAAISFVQKLRESAPHSHGAIHVQDVFDDFSRLRLLDQAQAIGAQAMARGGEPGEWLASLVAVELIRNYLPDSLRFETFGSLHLGAEDRPHRLFLLASIDSKNLRQTTVTGTQSGWFVGREAELDELRVAIDTGRVVTVTGASGVGKTALLRRFELENQDSFAGGSVWVDLRGISQVGSVRAKIAEAADVSARDEGSLAEAVFQYFGTAPALLIIDHFESAPGISEVVTELVNRCSEIQIVLAGRRRARLAKEIVVEVRGLAVPDLGEPLRVAEEYDSIKLFLERAQARDRFFQMHEGNLWAIVSICQFFDGSPLGIEVAASKLHLLSPQQVYARLRDLPEAFLRNASDPEISVERSVQASVELVGELPRVLLQRLSVFRGPFSVDLLAKACCDAELLPESRLLEALEPLIEVHLVTAWLSTTSDKYFVTSEAVRIYAASLLKGRERQAAVKAHQAAIVAWCDACTSQLTSNDPQSEERFRALFEDIQAALKVAAAHPKNGIWAMDVLIKAYSFWFKAGLYAELYDLGSLVINNAKLTSTPMYLRVVNLTAYCALRLGNLDRAKMLAKLAMREALKTEDFGTQGTIANTLSAIATEYRRPRANVRLLRFAVERVTLGGQTERAWIFLGSLAAAEAQAGNVVQAQDALRRADKLGLVSIGKWPRVTFLINQAIVFSASRSNDETWRALRDALDLLEESVDPHLFFRWLHFATTQALEDKLEFGQILASMAVSFFDQHQLHQSPLRDEEMRVWRFIASRMPTQLPRAIADWIRAVHIVINVNR